MLAPGTTSSSRTIAAPPPLDRQPPRSQVWHARDGRRPRRLAPLDGTEAPVTVRPGAPALRSKEHLHDDHAAREREELSARVVSAMRFVTRVEVRDALTEDRPERGRPFLSGADVL